MRNVVRLSFALFLASGEASANPARFELRGDACPASPIRARVAELIGADPFSDDARSVVSIVTSRSASSLVAEVSFDDEDGRHRGPRIVRAKTCAELVEATAIIVTMAFPEIRNVSANTPQGPDAETPPAESSTTDDAPPASPKESAETAPPKEEVRPLVDEAHRVAVTALAAEPRVAARRDAVAEVMVGATGRAASSDVREGLIVGVRWRRDGRSLTAEVSADAPQAIRVGTMAHVDLIRSEATISPCIHAGPVAGCLLASVGTIHGSGSGLASGRSAFTPLVAGGIRLTWEGGLSERIKLRLHLDFAALATRTQFDVDHMQVWATGLVEGSAGVALVAHFL